MIRRSPAEFYIKYLILHPDRLTDDDIVRTLRENQLDYPGPGYLDRVRATLKPPVPFYPLRETDLPSYRFLQKQKVHRLFFRDAHMDLALEVLQSPKAKEVMETLLILAAEPTDICFRLRKFGFNVLPKAVEYYAHFFMNMTLVDPTEIRALISVRVEDMQLLGDDRETAIRYKAMKQAMYADPRYMAANSPAAHLAAVRMQMRYGYKPQIDFGRLMEGMRDLATVSALETLLRGGPKSAAEARDLSVVIATVNGILTDQGGGSEELTRRLQTLGITTDTKPVPTIKQLTDGNFTDSVDLTKEAQYAKR
jgi:hypothetical protein